MRMRAMTASRINSFSSPASVVCWSHGLETRGTLLEKIIP